MLFLEEGASRAETGRSETAVREDIRVGDQMETLTTRFIAVYKRLGKLVGATEVKVTPTEWTGFGVTSDGKLNVEQKLKEKKTSYRFEDVINKMIEFERQAIPTKPPLTGTQPVVLVQEDIATLKL